jgi:HEAT repeat protein
MRIFIKNPFVLVFVLQIISTDILVGYGEPQTTTTSADKSTQDPMVIDHQQETNTENLGQEIAPADKARISALIKDLNDENGNVRFSAARALGQIGPDAKDAVPELIDALRDENSKVRIFATVALRNIGSDAVPAMIEALAHENESVRTRIHATPRMQSQN